MSPSTTQARQAPRGAARRTLLTAAPAALALAATAFLAGCASGPEATWSDPQLGGRPMQGARVLVVCEAAETTLQQVCLDRMSEEATARGLTPVRPAQPVASAAAVGRGAQAYVDAARAAGATGVLLTTVTPDNAPVARPSPFSIGIGGFGIGGGHVGVGAGVSVPIGGGGYAANPGYAANTSFSQAGNGKLLWSARTSTTTSDFNAGMGTMARTLMEAAEKAGVF